MNEKRGMLAMAPLRRRVIRLTGLPLTAVVIGGCSNSSELSGTEPDPALGPEPVLWNLGVDFDAAFDLGGVGTIIYKFLEFGFEVNLHRDGHDLLCLAPECGLEPALPCETPTFRRRVRS